MHINIGLTLANKQGKRKKEEKKKEEKRNYALTHSHPCANIHKINIVLAYYPQTGLLIKK